MQSTTVRRSLRFTKQLPYLVRYDTGTCSGKQSAPPCPECKPPPHPDCRGQRPDIQKAHRVVCCPPPTGSRPPCPSPPTAPIKNCSNHATFRKLSNDSGQRTATTSGTKECQTKDVCDTKDPECGQSRDHVAQRLAVAAEVRRRDYEQEVAQDQKQKKTLTEKIMYRLTGEKECAPATDGRNYAFQCPKEPMGKCGPYREPPPPQCVELVPKDKCQIRESNYLNPCAHRPPTLVHIDRSAPKQEEKRPKEPSPVRKFTSRFMKSLNRDKKDGKKKDPCKENKSKCSIASSVAPKPLCAKPGILETIKKHSPGKCSKDPNKRSFHTSSSSLKFLDINKALGKSDLNEAGLGRVLLQNDYRKSGKHNTQSAGCIELHVPAGAERVRVDVNIRSHSPHDMEVDYRRHSAHDHHCHNHHDHDHHCHDHHGHDHHCHDHHDHGHHKKAKPKTSSPDLTKKDSWLSIKGLQQKLRHEPAKETKGPEPVVKSPTACPSALNPQNKAPRDPAKQTPVPKPPSCGDTKRSFSTLSLTTFPVP